MTRIAKILRPNNPKRIVIPILTDDGDEAEISIWVGAEIEVYFDDRFNKAKAHIKRTVTIDSK